MKINYVTVAGSELGSFRYQLLTPAKELEKRGHEIIFSDEPIEKCDVYVFHKHFRPIKEQKMMKGSGGLSVFAVSDYHFNTVNRNHYLEMCKSADIVVSATRKLAEYIKQETGRESKVIYDPWGVEFDEQKPSFAPKDSLIALWFGHSSNLRGLQDNLLALDTCRIMIVTNAESPKVIPYSIENMKQAFRLCDFVVIPQNLSEPGKQTKTHNRIVDSFRAGKFVVASPVDSYLDFKDWAFIGDIKEGVQWLKKQPKEEIEKRILGAQEYIRKTFDPKMIGKQWEKTFMEGIQNG